MPIAVSRGRSIRPSWSIGSEPAQREDLHAQLLTLACLNLCEKSCHQHIDASALERRRLLAKGVNLDTPTGDGACPALSRTFGAGRCSVHAIRPTICRLWGASAVMPCEHGCVPEGGRVSDAQAMRWMLASYDIGGHADTSPDVRAVLEQCLADEYASALLSRYLRGDRSITVQLRDRLLQLRT